ncbi:response regulator [Stieleria sp. ICT_E10.1]|uniref:response regulator n=1 Tax=Stieleria sedimenti TaxID=2976331 RepID=UPI00217F7626|nr:response regulator [Stieleria sedimenti]MCS7469512.1 response regulator [Stieleria sedimenti]
MSTNSLVRFTRSCPTCGRRIQIRGSLLGRVVACRHCNAEFVASASDDATGCIDDAQRLMDRVESVLSRSQPPMIDTPASTPTPASTTTPAS